MNQLGAEEQLQPFASKTGSEPLINKLMSLPGLDKALISTSKWSSEKVKTILDNLLYHANFIYETASIVGETSKEKYEQQHVAESRLQNIRVWSDGFIDLLSNWSAFVGKIGDIAEDVFQLDLGAQVISMESRFKPMFDLAKSLTDTKQEFSSVAINFTKALLTSLLGLTADILAFMFRLSMALLRFIWKVCTDADIRRVIGKEVASWTTLLQLHVIEPFLKVLKTILGAIGSSHPQLSRRISSGVRVISALVRTMAFLIGKLQGGKITRLVFHSLYFVLFSLAKGSILIWNPVVSFFLSEITAYSFGRSNWLISRRKSSKKAKIGLTYEDQEAVSATRRDFGLETDRSAVRLRKLKPRQSSDDIDDSEVLDQIRGSASSPPTLKSRL